jgi:hypothetical protein
MKAVCALLAAYPVLACECGPRLTACNEVASSGAVFVGTVESTAPAFMGRWRPLPRPALNQLNAADERYLAGQTAGDLAALKDAFRKLFPSLPEDTRARLDSAPTHAALVSVFTSVLDHGQRVHFRVRTVYRMGDDGEDGTDDDAKPPASLDVWTPFGDCGVDFQPGETYLVYASSDEESGTLDTGSCTRTRRLTDAGEDLAYLYYYQDRKSPAARLEGFATFDPAYQIRQAERRDPERIEQPAPGVTIELKSPAGMRYTVSDAFGRFVFDGLEPGDHQVTAYGAGFPETVKILGGPKKFHAAPRACATATILVQ